MKRYTILLMFIALCSIAGFAQGGKTTASPSVTTVRDADQPAKQPFFKRTATNFSDLVTVPAGKVLVIESVSGKVNSFPGDTAPLTLYVIDYNANPIDIKQVHVLAPTFHSAESTTYYTHQVRYYVPAGLTVYAFWDGDGLVGFSANISGYFVNVP